MNTGHIQYSTLWFLLNTYTHCHLLIVCQEENSEEVVEPEKE